MITFCISLFSYAKGAPWPVWGFLFLGALCLISIFSLLRETKTQVVPVTAVVPITPMALQIEKKSLDLRLSPHGDNDESIYLEVKNQGDTIDVSAQLEIVGLSTTSRKFKTLPFNGRWKSDLTTVDFYNEQPESYVGNVRIETHKSRLLKIASLASMVGLDEQEMAIVGIDDETIGWESNPRQSQELPYFIIRITLIAKGYPKIKEATYKVGPKTSHGPFQMTEVVNEA